MARVVVEFPGYGCFKQLDATTIFDNSDFVKPGALRTYIVCRNRWQVIRDIKRYYGFYILHGLQCSYYEDGRTLEELYWCSHGTRDGPCYHYAPDGTLLRSQYYEHGTLQNIEEVAAKRMVPMKEELMQTVFHPDRIARLAAAHDIDASDYLDLLD